MTLNRIDLVSAGKLLGIIYAFLGLLAGGIFSLAAMAGAMVNQSEIVGLLFGAGAIIILPPLYGAMGFISGALSALAYNVAAATIGGLRFDVDFADPSYATDAAESRGDAPFLMD